MRIVKMSLVVALLVGSSAFAIDNIKMSGNAQVFYGTDDSITNSSLFDKAAAYADTGLNLNISADLVKNDTVSISAGAGYTAISSLGLENNLVSNVWGGAHTATVNGAKVQNANWFNEAWVAVTAGKSTAKLGRMELDTPLAFTEKWSIEKNTFEAAVLINQDIPDTTVIAAYIGNGNGTEGFGQPATNWGGAAPLVNANGYFGTYGINGAYTLGVINNSIEPLTIQAWYYDVSKVAQAYWLQADVNFEGIIAGAQYTSTDAGDYVSIVTEENNVYAVMLGYEMKDMVTAKVSYSQTNDDNSNGLSLIGGGAAQNTATDVGTAQSKLYTEAWWTYGAVTSNDTSAINVTIESPVQGIVDLGLYLTLVDHAAANTDLTEVALTASKSFGPLDATLALINVDTDDNTDAVNIVQAYLTVNF